MKIVLALLLAATASAFAQLSSANPIGVMAYSFPAAGSDTTSYISVPLTGDSAYAGPVQSFSASSITVSGTPFASGQLALPASPYFLHILTGQEAGRAMLITANTASSCTVDTSDHSTLAVPLNSGNFTVAAGDKFEIFPGDTLASFFGSAAASLSVVTGGASGFVADTVSIYNKGTAKFDSYFFNTTASEWRNISGSTLSANNVVLYPEAAIAILRRSGRAATLAVVSGCVPTTQPRTKVTGNNSLIYTSMRYPLDITLGEMTSFPGGFPLSGWTPGASAFTADVLSIFNPGTGKWEAYYLNGTTWYKSSTGANSNAVVLPARGAVALLKRGGTPPAASAFLYTTSLPYSF